MNFISKMRWFYYKKMQFALFNYFDVLFDKFTNANCCLRTLKVKRNIQVD